MANLLKIAGIGLAVAGFVVDFASEQIKEKSNAIEMQEAVEEAVNRKLAERFENNEEA